MKNIFVLTIISLLLLVASCKKDGDNNYIDSPIIKAYLETGNAFEINISRQITYDENSVYSDDDVNDLDIFLNYNGQSVILNPLGYGDYGDSTIIVSDGDEYTIEFGFNNKEVSAYTYVPSKPDSFTQSATSISIEKVDISTGPHAGGGGGITMPDPIELSWNNLDDSYYLVLAENMETVLDPIRDFGDADPPGNRFKKPPTNFSSQLLRANDFQYYGTHRIILYHVLPDYATLYDDNSTSSQNITNPSTCITNGFGIFTGFNSDTLYVNVLEL